MENESSAKLASEPYVWDGPTSAPPVSQIALCVMTKNGAARLPRLFESVKGFADLAIVLDTSTNAETLMWLKEQVILPVAVKSEAFTNFEVTRNSLFAYAKGKAEWLLLLDDDMALNFTLEKSLVQMIIGKTALNVPAYMMKHVGGLEYWVTRLVRGNMDWSYKGVTHEYLVGGGPQNPRLEGVDILHFYNHGPEKFSRDLLMLSTDIARDPNDHRTIFYLANTLRDAGYLEAAVRFFHMRAEMGGWEEEVYVSKYEAARLTQDPLAMARVYAFRPSRAEPSAWLALYYGRPETKNSKLAYMWETKRAETPPTKDILFVIPHAYGPELKPL